MTWWGSVVRVHSDAPDFLNLVFSFFPLFLLCIQYVKRFTLSSYALSEGESLWQLCYNFILLLMAHLATQWLSSLNRLLSRLIRNLVFCGRYGQKVKRTTKPVGSTFLLMKKAPLPIWKNILPD
ncbi:hypothetical protein UTI89_C1858 [Escherichia coli UTI89]|uniref:Uncharacterized protein n=1 Tax=Escherichia coli (strain UTI89 / UPEC) TaxID=364106 RepID=Q1RBD0_ECOUT|nr:hypothetical protein UTI89_C1858 [Escherichia coli UTI89]